MRRSAGLLAALLGLGLLAPVVHAAGKLSLYGVYMEPRWRDAADFSRPGWGGGMQAVVPVPQVHNLLAGVAGFDIVNLMSEDHTFYDPYLGTDIKQTTSQNYYRFYLGPRIGPHGNGLFRPHVGTNLAVVVYDISTSIVLPDESDPTQEVHHELRSRTEAVMGWDITAGIDLNIANRFPVDVGIRYLKSFNVPLQLGPEAVTVYPQYLQVYLGLGASFALLEKS